MSQRRKVARRVRDGVPIDRKALRDLRVRLNVSQNDLMMRADKEGDDIIGEGYISTLEREGGKRDRKKVEAIEKALQKLCDETGVTYRTIRLAGSGAGTLGVPMQATVGTSAAVPLPSNAGLSAWDRLQFERVSYTGLGPVRPEEIQVSIVQRKTPDSPGKPELPKILLSPPTIGEMENIFKELQREISDLDSTLCLKKLQDKRIFLTDSNSDIYPQNGDDSLDVFRHLKTKGDILFTGRVKAIKEFLHWHFGSKKEGKGFAFNGQLMAVSGMTPMRLPGASMSIDLKLQLTDYYSYRVIAACSNEIVSQLTQNKHFQFGRHLRDYLSDLQKVVHLSASAVILVVTNDNRLYIRRRSYQAADFEDGGKLYISACEGIYKEDEPRMKEPYWVLENGYYTLDFEKVVRNALRQELFGDNLPAIKECHCIGTCVYTPNLSVPLFFLVKVDCSAQQTMNAELQAPHASEFKKYADPREERPIPQFTRSAIKEYVNDTIGKGTPNDAWAEGALAAVMLAQELAPD